MQVAELFSEYEFSCGSHGLSPGGHIGLMHRIGGRTVVSGHGTERRDRWADGSGLGQSAVVVRVPVRRVASGAAPAPPRRP